MVLLKLGFGIIVMASVIIIATGCSVNGWATKPVADGSNLKTGETVRIIQKNGYIIAGKFEKIQTLTDDEYKSSYNDPLQNYFATKILPRIGQTVFVRTILSENKTWKGVMVGFDHEGLLLTSDDNETRKYYIGTVNDMTSQDGKLIPKMKLRELFLNGDIPSMTVLAVQTDRGEMKIPINTIDNIIVAPALANDLQTATPALNKAELLQMPAK